MFTKKEINLLIECIREKRNPGVIEVDDGESALEVCERTIPNYKALCDLENKVRNLHSEKFGASYEDDGALWDSIINRAILLPDGLLPGVSKAKVYTTLDNDEFLCESEDSCEVLADFFQDIMPGFTFQTGQYEEDDFDEDDPRINMYYIKYE